MDPSEKVVKNHEFFVPHELVEHSAFLDKGSGVINIADTSLCQKINTVIRDGQWELLSF